MSTYDLTSGTDALRAAIRAEFSNNDMSAQKLAVVIVQRLKNAGWVITPSNQGDLRAKIIAIADDFHPDPGEAELALEEMRNALLALIL